MNSKIPVILNKSRLTSCPFIKEFINDFEEIHQSYYDSSRMINIHANGTPLYLALFKQPPTSTQTPGKMIPGGYTPSGKYKPARYTSLKTDKRAGK